MPCVEAHGVGYSGAATVRSRKGPGTKVDGCSGTTEDIKIIQHFAPTRSIRPESQALTATRKIQQRAPSSDSKVLKQGNYSKNKHKSHANRNATALWYESFSTTSCRRSPSPVKPPLPPDGTSDTKDMRKVSVVDSLRGHRQGKGTGKRRPWGAGPGLASRVGHEFSTLRSNSSGGTPTTAPSMRHDCSLPTELKKPGSVRSRGCRHHIGPRASTATGSSSTCRRQRQSLTRPKPSTDFRASETSAADIRLFLPTWGALVAKGAWLRGSCVDAGEDCAGDVRSGAKTSRNFGTTTP